VVWRLGVGLEPHGTGLASPIHMQSRNKTVGFQRLEEATRQTSKNWTDEVDEDWSKASKTERDKDRAERRGAAIVVQRWYRKQVLKYAIFGPMIFTRKDGKMADFGKLSFSTTSRSAHYVRVSDTTSTPALAHFVVRPQSLTQSRSLHRRHC
jgi:hypothetical protein